jgi:hypothetical protein
MDRPLLAEEPPTFYESIPLWPDTCCLVAALVLNSIGLGLVFGIMAVIPIDFRSAIAVSLIMTVVLFSLFRFFRLANFVIFFFASFLSACGILIVGHLYAYWLSHAAPLLGEGMVMPNNLIDLALLPFFVDNPLILRYFLWDFAIWLAQATIVLATAIVAPLLVCVMYAEAED